MVIDHADGLGKGIDDHRPAEIEAALFQVVGQAFAHFGLGRNLVAALEMIDLRLAADMLPDQFAEAARLLFLDLQPSLAPLIAASILARLRMMPSFFSSRSMSRAP